MSTVAAVLAEARKHLGYYRRPGTATVFGQWYADQVGSRVYITAQWCAIFISYIAQATGASKIIPLHAYTPSGVNWWKAQGKWHTGLSGVRAGDIVYFDFPGLPNRVSHVGIVESVNSDGSVNTIEGNTSSTAGGDQRNSGTCARKRRKAYIVGYGRPPYTTAPKPPAKPAEKPATAGTHTVKPDVPGWFTVTAAVLNGRTGPSLKHKVKHKRARGYHLYIAKTVKSGGITWGVTNYGTHYAMQYLKKGKH